MHCNERKRKGQAIAQNAAFFFFLLSRILPTLQSPNRNGERKRQGVRSGCRLQWLQWFAVEIQGFSSIGLFCWAMKKGGKAEALDVLLQIV